VALPIKTFDLVSGLSIQKIAVFGENAEHPDISLSLPSLRQLIIGSIKLINPALPKVHGLTFLLCDENQLTKLDLSNTPNLTKLWCRGNLYQGSLIRTCTPSLAFRWT
jgi:Leucine-rich repeat (LRR) protein